MICVQSRINIRTRSRMTKPAIHSLHRLVSITTKARASSSLTMKKPFWCMQSTKQMKHMHLFSQAKFSRKRLLDAYWEQALVKFAWLMRLKCAEDFRACWIETIYTNNRFCCAQIHIAFQGCIPHLNALLGLHAHNKTRIACRCLQTHYPYMAAIRAITYTAYP